MATTRRKLLGTATFSFGGTPVTLGVTSIPTGVSPETEIDEAAAFGDTVATRVPRNLATLGDLTVECIYEGAAPALAVGQIGDVAISLMFRNGVDADVTAAINEPCGISQIEYGAVEVDGDRKATITITLAPVGGADRSDVDFSAGTAANK